MHSLSRTSRGCACDDTATKHKKLDTTNVDIPESFGTSTSRTLHFLFVDSEACSPSSSASHADYSIRVNERWSENRNKSQDIEAVGVEDRLGA